MRRPPSRSFALPSTLFIVCLLMALAAWGRGPHGAAEPVGTAATRLLRFPALSKDSIAFVYGGDIWTGPRAGGAARQLTPHPGLPIPPPPSPGGTGIAFTRADGGNRVINVTPPAGAA